MLKKLFMTATSAIVLASAISVSTNSYANQVTAAPPIHWGKSPMSGQFKNGKDFCHKKYFGEKTCIPVMNNTQDILTFTTSDYSSVNAPANSVNTLIGRQPLSTVLLTVNDSSGNSLYSGPANNREGIACNADANNAVTCSVWQ